MSLKTEAGFLAGGLLVHGLFLLVAWRTPAPTYSYTVDPTMEVDLDLSKEVVKEDVHENEDRRPVEPGSVARTSDVRPDGRPNPVSGAIDPKSTEPATGPAAETPPTGPAPSEYEDAPPGANTWQMPAGSLGGPPVYTLRNAIPDQGPAPAAPTTAPAAKKVDRDKANEILTADVLERNKKLGLNLPAAGTVASILKSVVWASDAPQESKASFQIVLGPDGKVQSVRVGSANGGSAAIWEAVAANLKASLASQSLKLNGDYAKGAIITINVQSKMQMPSGNKSGDPLSLNVGKGGPGGTFDLADIGARPIRQVLANFNVVPIK